MSGKCCARCSRGPFNRTDCGAKWQCKCHGHPVTLERLLESEQEK